MGAATDTGGTAYNMCSTYADIRYHRCAIRYPDTKGVDFVSDNMVVPYQRIIMIHAISRYTKYLASG